MIKFSERRTEASQPKAPNEKNKLCSVKRLNNRLVNKIQCQLMESGTHRNISSKYMEAARGFALPWRKNNLESWLSEIWPWYVICTQLLSPMVKRLCRSVKLFQDYNNMNTSVEQLYHEERVNGTGKLSEISKRMILWRRWIKRKYWASIIVRWELKGQL